MLLVDNRIGSADLADPLAHMGLPVELTRLEAGDIAFSGRGTGDSPLAIGIELKRLTSQDLVSSIKTGRLNAQGTRMLGPQGLYDVGWLLIEGRYRVNKHGQVLVKKPRKYRGGPEWVAVPGLLASQMEKRVLTLELCGGFHVRFTDDRHATLHFLSDLYRWWTDAPLDGHRSHLAEHKPSGFLPVSDFRSVVNRFPGLGLRTSLGVETHFIGSNGKPSLRRATNAGVDEWAAVTTLDKAGKPRRLGIKVAEKIVAFCKGEA